MRVHGKFDDLGRFADPSLLILTSLADGPKHGYAIMTDVAGFSGVQMEPGTLYGALSRLERRGWVRRQRNPRDRRVQWVQRTEAGDTLFARALPLAQRAEAQQLAVLSVAQQRRLVAAMRKLVTISK